MDTPAADQPAATIARPAVARPVHDRLEREKREMSREYGRKVTISEVIERLFRLADKARAAGLEDDR